MKRYLRIIIMASGQSIRFGENKLLVEVNGKPMVHHVMENVSTFLEKYPDDGVGIVVSSYDEILIHAKTLGLQGIKNKNAKEGQSESIKLGLTYSINQTDHMGEVAVFLTADQPWMRLETLEEFLLRAKETEFGFLCASFQKKSGSPVSFDEKYYEELLALKEDQGGKSIMNKHLDNVEYMEINFLELKDVDMPEDLR